MTDDMHRYMTELGSSSTPEPDPGFVTDLELQLRANRAGATGHRFAGPRRWPATVAAVTFSVAVVAFGLATVDSSPQVVTISAASGAEVRMPDGQVIAATPGLELPNGAVVEVGPSGSARIGDMFVGPLQAAEITAEGVIVAGDEIAGPIRLTTTSWSGPRSASQTSTSAPAPDNAGASGALGSSGTDDDASSSTSEPVVTSTQATATSVGGPNSSVAVDDSAVSPTAGVISATSIVRNDSTTTTDPTPDTIAGGTTSTSTSSSLSSSTTVPPTTSVSTSSSTSSSTTEPDSTTTTEHPDETTTSTSSSTTTTQATSTSTSTTVDPTSTTSTTSTPEPAFLQVIGQLSFERASCRLDAQTLIFLVYAVASDSLSPSQSATLSACLDP